MGFIANLKSVFTADTKDLKKGAAEAKQAVKDFDATTTDALNEVTSLFGVSMGEIGKTLSTIRGGFIKLSGGISSTTKEVGFLAKAWGVLKTAMISSGVGALVVALGSLVAYLTKSQRGADKLAVVMGQVKQVFKTVTDYAIRLGENVVGFFDKIIDKVAVMWENFKVGGGYGSMIGPEEKAIDSVFARRKKLTLEQQEYEKKRIEFKKREKELELAIEEQREISADKANKSLEERAAANKKAQELVNQLFEERTVLAKEALRLLQEDNSLSESMNADKEAEIDLEIALLEIAKQRAAQNKELLAQEAEIANQKKAQADAEIQAKAKALDDRKKKDLTLEKIDSSAILDKAFDIPEPKIPEQKFKELESYMINIGEIATGFSNTISDAFSSMIEGLVSGELDMRDIFQTVLQFLAENLKAIGKALIAYGMSLEAFKNAFKGPGGAIKAIAAGAALVAAGAVLSGLIKRASSGGGSSASASYAAAASVGGGGTLDLTSQTQMKSQEIKVTGTIKASGRDLVVVIENEQQRKNLTT